MQRPASFWLIFLDLERTYLPASSGWLNNLDDGDQYDEKKDETNHGSSTKYRPCDRRKILEYAIFWQHNTIYCESHTQL